MWLLLLALHGAGKGIVFFPVRLDLLAHIVIAKVVTWLSFKILRLYFFFFKYTFFFLKILRHCLIAHTQKKQYVKENDYL